MNKFLISRLFVSFLLLMFARATFASDSVSNMLSESIYLLELLVIAIVTIALIMITVSIAKSRHKIFKVASDLREEMGQERVVLKMTMNSIKEKEEQITYIAHLLQEHLEESVIDGEMESSQGKKKVSEDSYIGIVEVIDEFNGHQFDNDSAIESTQKTKDDANSFKQSQDVDPRTISADGSVKQSHFGPDQYLGKIESYQQQAQQHLKELVQQTNQNLSNSLRDIRGEIDVIRAQRVKLNDFVAAIESNIIQEATYRMNSKDKKLVQRLIDADKQLHTLERQQKTIEKQYAQVMAQDDVAVDNEQEKVQIVS